MQRLPTFSKDGYEEVLKNALDKGYDFILFASKDDSQANKRQCLMRHDIDTSLKCAIEMAVLEHSLGIRATYFFMLRSPAYNLFSRYAFDILEKINEMGHEIALHFDAAHPAVKQDNLVERVEQEANILAGLCGHQISAVSFHQPSEFILKGDLLIPNLTNTYNKAQMADWYYTSDSNRIWKEHNAFSAFDCDRYRKIQMLTHPIWWIYGDTFIEDAWDHAIVDNFYIMQKQFLDTEGAYGFARTFNLGRKG